ncbi:MAG: hypothetical protein MUO26_05665 [Methanotrichaceae archaeon]|nr:hypothetical protein [Methanotrichaceae archaeon]
MKIKCWYKSGSLDMLRDFCIQNRNKQVSLKLISRSEPVKGALYAYCLDSWDAAGLFLLLTDRVTQPAYYGLDGIESLHAGFKKQQATLENCEFSLDRSSSEIAVSRLADHSAQ